MELLFNMQTKSSLLESLTTISLAPTHEESFGKWSFTTAKHFDLAALENMVKKELPASVYRCKGFVYADDSPNKYILQIVGRRVRLTEDINNDDETQQHSKIVAIGNKNTMDESQLSMLFEKCLSIKEIIH